MDSEEAIQVLDGAMLSDGNLSIRPSSRNAIFQVAVSGVAHCDWLRVIRSAVEELTSVRTPIGVHPRIGVTGKLYDYCYLQSRSSLVLTVQYSRWYSSRRKVIPKDLILTPVSLAHWYMGDGYSSWSRGDHSCAPVVRFSTPCYTLDGIVHLETQLRNLGITSLGRCRADILGYGAGVVISVLAKSQPAFMDLVESYVVPSYLYKVKRRVTRPQGGGVACQ